MSSLRTRKGPGGGSIRTKQPSSSRQQPQQSNKLSKSSKDARVSRVDDRIKKRISMRYADISGPTAFNGGAPAVPSIPSSLMAGGGARGGRGQGRGGDDESVQLQPRKPTKEELKEAENKFLDADTFDADAFLKLKLANSTEAEVKSLQSSLQSSKDDVAVDLQKNVFKNYVEFVIISKEISTLENEMLELKESLAEWKSMPSVLHIDEAASAADRRRNVRSSVADLRVLYANQMQALHTQIEGSAKFVPTTPGRHVVAEMDNLMSLNAATYKPMMTVKFVVLDDMLLIARKRRRRNPNESDKLVADRCFPLIDTLVQDSKDSPALVNVFKIKHAKETYVYRTETSADKRTLLGHLRHAGDEVLAKKRKERENEHERRRTVFTKDDRQTEDWMKTLAQQAGVSNTEKENAEDDTRWIAEFTDELSVAIALREWEKAVALVEKGETKKDSMPSLAAKLNPLTSSLTTSLLDALSNSQIMKASAVRFIQLLSRLHAGPAARKTFLAARSETIKRLVRKIGFQGQVGLYVNDLAVVIFTVIKHTADWYLAGFRENEDASTLVEWAKMHVERFAELFRTHVYIPDVQPSIVEEALNITYLQHRKLLNECGIDFRFLLEDILLEHPKKKEEPPPVIVNPIPVRAQALAQPTPRTSRSTPTPSRSRTPVSSQASTTSAPPIPPIPTSRPSSSTRPTTPSARPVTPSSSSLRASGGASSRPTTPSSPRFPAQPPPLPPSLNISPAPVRFGSVNRPTTPDAARGRASPAPPPRSRDRPPSSFTQQQQRTPVPGAPHLTLSRKSSRTELAGVNGNGGGYF